jgi:hypothetical protein
MVDAAEVVHASTRLFHAMLVAAVRKTGKRRRNPMRCAAG